MKGEISQSEKLVFRRGDFNEFRARRLNPRVCQVGPSEYLRSGHPAALGRWLLFDHPDRQHARAPHPYLAL